uniref:Vacuolar-sorting protein SNF8 n=1 Tax=Graphocephala atropunctata TaxID=36148 RepID=A0A1B6M4S6_9HEMI
MRRRAGVGAIQKQKLEQEKYKDKGTEIQENQLEQMSKQLEVFRNNLEEFASKHKNEIKKNATFRRQFQEMCASIGVDPLASGKGFWSVLGIGDFYYELGVQIVEVCLATNDKNGGLISLEEVRQRLIKARGKSQHHQEITNEDLLCAARKLKIFGNGFTIVPVGKGQYLVQSVPGELSMDHTAVLQQAANLGCGHVSVSTLKDKLGWEGDRSLKALNHMIKEGLAWIDTQNVETLYYFPSLFSACVASEALSVTVAQ